MDIKVYVCHHKAWPILKNDIFQPIQVGRSLAKEILPNTIGDNTGDNISYKNKEWCELTALYWIWKNTTHDYVGLMHYRRYISFNPIQNQDTFINNIPHSAIEENRWCYDGIEELTRKYSIITSNIYNIHPCGIPHFLQTSYDHYCEEHYKKDIDLMLDIIKRNYPEYYIDSLTCLYSTQCFFGNISIMQRDIFNKYCDFVFSVLSDVERKIDILNYTPYQKRVFGFLAERLSNIFVENVKSKNKSLKILHAPMVYVGNDTSHFNKKQVLNKVINYKPQKLDVKHGGKINIVMSFDDKYFLHALATIESLLLHTSNAGKINFYVIYDIRLSEENVLYIKKRYSKITTFHFVNAKQTFINKFPLNRDYISINTYYRLIIQELIPSSINRIIYLDSDIIVCNDITKLWNIDLSGKILAGSQDEGGLLQSRRLFGNTSNNTYINAGVIILDLKAAIQKYGNISFKYSEDFYRNQKKITLQDQDILNISYKNDIFIVPLNWNVNSRVYSANDLDRAYNIQEEKNARENPFIVHFTDRNKPWKFSCNHPLKELYWFYRGKAKYNSFSFYDIIAKYNKKVQISVHNNYVYINYNIWKIRLPENFVTRVLKLIKK